MTAQLQNAIRAAGRTAVACARAELLQAGRDALEHGAAVATVYDQLDAIVKSNATDDGINERLIGTAAVVTRRCPAALTQVLDELHRAESDPLITALAVELLSAAADAARQVELLSAADLRTLDGCSS